MTTLLHGTAMESALKILRSSAFDSSRQVWDASFANKAYFRILRTEDPCDAVSQVIGNAQIAAAYKDSKCRDIAIMVLTMSDDVFGDNFTDDYSVAEAPDCVEIDTGVLNRLISDGSIRLSAKKCANAYEPLMRAWYMCYLDKNCFSYPDKYVESICETIHGSRDDMSWTYEALNDYGTDLDAMPEIDPAAEPKTTISLSDALEITGAKDCVLAFDIDGKDGGRHELSVNAIDLESDTYIDTDEIRVSKISPSRDAAQAAFTYELEDVEPRLLSWLLGRYGHVPAA